MFRSSSTDPLRRPVLSKSSCASRPRESTRVAPLAAKQDALLSVGDPSVTELGGATVNRRLDRSSLERVAELMVTGRLDPHITATYPLARAEEALALVESGHASGKLVIDMRL